MNFKILTYSKSNNSLDSQQVKRIIKVFENREEFVFYFDDIDVEININTPFIIYKIKQEVIEGFKEPLFLEFSIKTSSEKG